MLMSNGKIILAGGSTPKHGKLNTVFEYHPVYGFKLLETTLAAPRLVRITTQKKKRMSGNIKATLISNKEALNSLKMSLGKKEI